MRKCDGGCGMNKNLIIKLWVLLSCLFFVDNSLAESEVVGGRRWTNIFSSGRGDINEIKNEVDKVKSFLKENVNRVQRTEKYALIKKYNCETGYFDTYVVNMKSSFGGPAIMDKFSTAVGSNGVGCGTGQTRPGIFKLRAWKDKPDVGASKKSGWGNKWKMFYQDRVDGMRGCSCPDCVFHSRTSMKEPPPKKTIKVTKSAGCTTVAESIFDKFDENGEYHDLPGNTLVLNPTAEEYRKAVSSCGRHRK